MRASACVGRVGGLAVALGIGVAVTVSGATSAWAAPSDSAYTGGDAASGAAPVGGQASRSVGRGRGGGAAASDSVSGTTTSRSEASRTKNQPRAAAVLAPASQSSTATKVSAPAPAAARQDSKADAFNLPVVSPAIQATSEPEAVFTPSLAGSAEVGPVAAAVTPAAPAMTVAAPAYGVDSASNPFAGHNSPLNPAQSAVSWMVVAAAHRDRGSARAAHSVSASLVSTSDLADTESVAEAVELTGTRARPAAAIPTFTGSAQSLSPLAAATAADPISAFVGQIQAFVTQIVQAITQAITAIINVFVPAPAPVNMAPVALAPTAGTPDPATGVVTGQVNATDPDGDPLSYAAPATTSKGSVVIDSSTGVFTYTPTVAARDNAAQAGATDADKADTFVVSITDGRGGSSSVSVAVAISPLATTPPQLTVGIPNLSTGVVAGSVIAPTIDETSLTYSAPSSTAKGSIVIDSSTGAFTYTPTATARHNASAVNATATVKADTFTVTVTDSVGVVRFAMPVTVPIRPANISPTGTATVGTLDPATGVINGLVLGVDGDGDILTYSGNAVTAEGRVTIDSRTGAFSYTPVARVDTVTSVISGFNSPTGVVFSPDGSRAYVLNNKGNSVSVVDTATKTIVSTVGGFSSPNSLAITPNGSRLYVVGTSSVSILNTATNTVTNISGLYAPAGGIPKPVAVAISPDGTLAYVANSTDGVSIIDTASGLVATTIALSSYTYKDSVWFSADGRRAYIGAGTYTQSIDTSANSTFYTAVNGGYGVVSSDGSSMYTLRNSRVEMYDGEPRLLKTSESLPLRALALGRDGSLLYGLGDKGQIVLINPATLTSLGTTKRICATCGTSPTVNSASGPNGIAVSPDGSTVYAVNPNNGTISVLTTWVGPTTDTFTVTVTDGHGGTTTVPVTVSFVG